MSSSDGLAAERRAALGPGLSPKRLAWQRFLAHPAALPSLILLVLLTAGALAAPLVEALLGVDATRADLLGRYEAPSAAHALGEGELARALLVRLLYGGRLCLVEARLLLVAARADLLARYAAPSSAHPLGKAELGRDLLVRLLYGGRLSLAVGLVAALAATVIGSLLGLLAGYFGGRLDALLMRLADSILALPLLPLLIVLAAVDLGKLGLPQRLLHSEMTSFWQIVVLIALFGWTTVARLVRGSVMSLKRREFVRAAEALGASPWRIM